MRSDQTWRLIFSGAGRGDWNMAVDEALLEAVSEGKSNPVIRFYDWDPACLSLGYGQKYRDVDEAGLRENGWDVVRRPTGGRAILHVDELTYSIAASAEHPLMKAGILPSYKDISLALLNGLNILAVPAAHEERYDLPPDADPKGPVCFEVPSNWEITFEGKKLVGSAQVRRSGGVLQHGTLPLHGDLTRIVRSLAFDTPEERQTAGKRLLERAVTVETAVGRRVTWDEAAAALASGLSESLGVRLIESDLTPEEFARAKALTAEKYAHSGWTKRR